MAVAIAIAGTVGFRAVPKGLCCCSRPPGGIDVPRLDRNNPYREAVMSEIVTVGLDLAKNVFQVHGADSEGRAV